MTGMIQRLASSSFRHPWRTLSAWLLGLIVIIAVAGAVGTHFSTGGRLHGTDSDRAYELLVRDFPDPGTETASIVVHRAGGLTDPHTQAEIVRFIDSAATLTRGGAISSGKVSEDGTTEVFTADMPVHTLLNSSGTMVALDVAHDLVREGADLTAGDPELEIAFGGHWFSTGNVPASAEQIGIIAAIVVLLLTFGSLVAAGVTLLPALLAVAGSGAVVTVVSRLIATPDVTETVATMIGLGVGIDYALFIITRFRRELIAHDPAEALRIAMATAGRAVALAGGTVAISLLGMFLIGLEFLHGLAIGASVAVGVSVLSAMTLLPALLRWSTRSMTKRARAAEARIHGETWWHRWGRAVADRPVRALIGGLAVLTVFAAPALWMRLAAADAGNDALGTTTRSAYDRIAGSFGAGVNGPLLVAVADTTAPALDDLAARIARTPGVAAVAPPVLASRGTTAVIDVIPSTAPQSAATEALVERLRHEVIPGAGVTAHVGGVTASNVDFALVLRHRLPLFIAGVLTCSFLLLMVVFRSVLVPLKAVVLNLLSIGAAFGAMVAVFQWGWFAGLLGVHSTGPVEPWAPMLLFAIVFGLSMDYEVFLLSAVKEHYDAGVPNRRAVIEGLSSTARVITAAAAIMVAVFAGFLTADVRAVQLMGFGLAFAVLIDATVVRLVLVPASMELLGDRNWWLPRFIDARLPRVELEALEDPSPVNADDDARLVGSSR